MAIIFLTTAIAMSVAGYYVTRHEITKICTQLEEVIQTGETEKENEASLYEQADSLVKKWFESDKILTILLKHSQTIEINQNIRLIQNFIEVENRDELLKACNKAQTLLLSVLDSEHPSIKNIF
ncbi:MAG: DUF4363 family protein [Oscillospiraceae bacterium]|nr:DUF4363 family protein [Oscillospiraceae bacterium]